MATRKTGTVLDFAAARKKRDEAEYSLAWMVEHYDELLARARFGAARKDGGDGIPVDPADDVPPAR